MVLNAFVPELVRQRTGGDVAGSRRTGGTRRA
jgi:hypothetical protein